MAAAQLLPLKAAHVPPLATPWCARTAARRRHRRHRAELPQQRLSCHSAPPRRAAHARPLLRGDGTAATAPRCLSSACHATCAPPRGAARARRLLRGDGTAATALRCLSGACHPTARRPEELHARGDCCAAPPPPRRAASAAPATPRHAAPRRCTRTATAARRRHRRHCAALPQQRLPRHLRAAPRSHTRAATAARAIFHRVCCSLRLHAAHGVRGQGDLEAPSFALTSLASKRARDVGCLRASECAQRHHL